MSTYVSHPQGYDKANPGFFGANGPYATLYVINSIVFCNGLILDPLLGGSLEGEIGYGKMNTVIAAICFVTSVLSFVYIGGRPKVLDSKMR